MDTVIKDSINSVSVQPVKKCSSWLPKEAAMDRSCRCIKVYKVLPLSGNESHTGMALIYPLAPGIGVWVVTN
jgi:hypothetical protein